MSTTPNLGLELVPANSLQPSIAINDALQVLDAITQLSVQDKDLTTPPATSAGDAGKRWIVGASATGAWNNKDGQIALCTGATLWRFIPPGEGWEAWVIDEGKKYRYTSGAWGII